MYSPRKLAEKSHSFWADPFPVTAESPSQNPQNSNINLDKNALFIISIIAFGVILSFIMNFLIEKIMKRLISVSSDHPATSPSLTLGIKQEVLQAFPVVTYSAATEEMMVKLGGQDAECVICLSEFVSGDQVRVLPKCSHGFHAPCIDQWLGEHSTCPKCRNCLMNISEKIADHAHQSCGQIAPSVPQVLPAQGSTAHCAITMPPETNRSSS